jgi:broad specificity phosphatase PhoE
MFESHRFRAVRGPGPVRAPRAGRAAMLLLVGLAAACARAPATPGPAGAAAQPSATWPAAAPAPVAQGAARTVIVTRHAERADDGTTRDPALDEAGERRARALADALAGAGVDAILTTQFLRTRGTAAPLAERLGISAQVVEAGGGTTEHIAALRRVILARPAGSVTLVVGHSNTVPLLVRDLTGSAADRVPDMPESEYGTLYIITLSGDTAAAARVIRASYPAAG